MAVYLSDCFGEKEIIRPWGLLDPGSELTLTLGHPMPLWPQMECGSSPSHSGPSESLNPFCGYFLNFEMYN